MAVEIVGAGTITGRIVDRQTGRVIEEAVARPGRPDRRDWWVRAATAVGPLPGPAPD